MFGARSSIYNRDVLALAEQSFHSAKAFGASHPTPPEGGLGVHKELGGTQLGQLTPADPRDIPHHKAS